MRNYAGLDVSNKEKSICIINEDNKVVRRLTVRSDPDAIAKALISTGLEFTLIGMETGSLSH